MSTFLFVLLVVWLGGSAARAIHCLMEADSAKSRWNNYSKYSRETFGKEQDAAALNYAKYRAEISRSPLWPLTLALHGGAWYRKRRAENLKILKRAEELKNG